jgi:hypothetical protein
MRLRNRFLRYHKYLQMCACGTIGSALVDRVQQTKIAIAIITTTSKIQPHIPGDDPCKCSVVLAARFGQVVEVLFDHLGQVANEKLFENGRHEVCLALVPQHLWRSS